MHREFKTEGLTSHENDEKVLEQIEIDLETGLLTKKTRGIFLKIIRNIQLRDYFLGSAMGMQPKDMHAMLLASELALKKRDDEILLKRETGATK